jgi:hypothetical protein
MKNMKKRLLLVITAVVLAASIVLGSCVTKPSQRNDSGRISASDGGTKGNPSGGDGERR